MTLRFGTLCVWILASSVVLAEFWDEKDFLAWTDNEVSEMLSDSPWSREVTVALWPPQAAASRPRGRGADGGPENDGGLRRVPDDESSGGRARTGVSPRLMTLTVSWRSAQPVKQALVRRRLGPRHESPLPFEEWAFLTQFEPLYIVSVSGFPRQYALLAEHRETLRAEARLRREDKAPIPAEDVEVFVQNDETVIVEFAFSRDNPITLLDEEVEFSAKFGEIQVKRKFDLADMRVAGDLVL